MEDRVMTASDLWVLVAYLVVFFLGAYVGQKGKGDG